MPPFQGTLRRVWDQVTDEIDADSHECATRAGAERVIAETIDQALPHEPDLLLRILEENPDLMQRSVAPAPKSSTLSSWVRAAIAGRLEDEAFLYCEDWHGTE